MCRSCDKKAFIRRQENLVTIQKNLMSLAIDLEAFEKGNKPLGISDVLSDILRILEGIHIELKESLDR